MNHSIEQMLKKYDVSSPEAKKNAVKEIMQEIVLCGLSRAGFFNKAAFYGGTALRIFYGLDRFSEDLDFSLVIKDIDFDLTAYFPVLEKEVASYGLKVEITAKNKTKESMIKSAFLKGNTKEHILMFYPNEKIANNIHSGENIKIKFEVDIDPPMGASFETRFQLLPAPYQIKLYDAPSLFAGKLHAVICRAWGNRIKGRDLYDYIFYRSRGTKVNMTHLRARLIESGAITQDEEFDIIKLKDMLNKRFDNIDYKSAKEDVRSFINDKESLNIWCAEMFKQITDGLEADVN